MQSWNTINYSDLIIWRKMAAFHAYMTVIHRADGKIQSQLEVNLRHQLVSVLKSDDEGLTRALLTNRFPSEWIPIFLSIHPNRGTVLFHALLLSNFEKRCSILCLKLYLQKQKRILKVFS